jgi:hypothetical protein
MMPAVVLTPAHELVLQLPSLAHAQTATLHYGFNGWNVKLPGGGQDVQMNDLNYFKEVPLTRDAAGAFRAKLAIPPEARALHFAVCRDECGSGQWDNNGGADYAWPLTYPYVGPLLTFGEGLAPDQGLVISFLDTTDAPGWVTVDGRTLRDAGGERHSFTVSGLKPDTVYSYQVGAGERRSATYTFRTAKAQKDLAQVRFAAFSDAQDDGETGHFAATVQELLAHHDDLDFLVVAGDMTWNDHPGEWWTYFDIARPLLAHKVVMPAIGNHDTPTVDSNPDHTSFPRFYAALPQHARGDFYRFDFANARFFALDSESMLDFAAPGGKQFQWLSGELRRDKPEWTFTFWHIPPFNAGARHWQQQFDERALARTFPGAVDWDISGHEHLAQRFAPIAFDGAAPYRAATYAGGTGFIVLPAAGAPPETALVAKPELRGLLAFPDRAGDEAAAFNGFERIDIDGNAVRLRLFDPYAVRDEVRYSK